MSKNIAGRRVNKNKHELFCELWTRTYEGVGHGLNAFSFHEYEFLQVLTSLEHFRPFGELGYFPTLLRNWCFIRVKKVLDRMLDNYHKLKKLC